VPIRARRADRQGGGATVECIPRARRTTFPDGLYHITGRATGNEVLFPAGVDHDEFRRLVALTAARHEWCVHARCSMGNHFHLLVDTTCAQMSTGMHLLQHTYAKRFNKRYGRRG
jgi:REP element-mobilizing transposase RayT